MKRACLVFGLATAGMAAPPPPSLILGFEERIRSEDWDDVVDHDHNRSDVRHHVRFRTRLWANWKPDPRLEFTLGLNNENRKTYRPDGFIYNGREVLVETLYVDWKPNPTWSLRAGRQNLVRGEGFILFDGTPGDGSRTGYYNALDLSYRQGEAKLEFLAISNPSKDHYLPVQNEIKNPKEQIPLIEWDEKALGFYFTGPGWKDSKIEAYWLYKTETSDIRPLSNPLRQPDRKFHTLGARAIQELPGSLQASGEFALQRGKQEGSKPMDIEAWGGYLRLKKSWNPSWKPSLSLAYIALSGQDLHSEKVTAWNPLFSRWPRWSELFILSQIPEKGVAYWSNLGMTELEFRCKLHPRVDLRANWYKLSALQPLATSPGPIFSTGKDRGRLWQVRFDYTFKDCFKAHALYEHFQPGQAYAFRDPGHFLRLEFSYQFLKPIF